MHVVTTTKTWQSSIKYLVDANVVLVDEVAQLDTNDAPLSVRLVDSVQIRMETWKASDQLWMQRREAWEEAREKAGNHERLSTISLVLRCLVNDK